MSPSWQLQGILPPFENLKDSQYQIETIKSQRRQQRFSLHTESAWGHEATKGQRVNSLFL